MRLRRLELSNYRRYEEASLEIPDGIIGFVGRNGAGKSTVIEAVTWCLFGHEAARTTKDLIKRTEAAPGQDCRVSLEFEVEGQGYRVTRRMRGASLVMDLTVEANGQLVVSGGPNSSAQGLAFIQRLLGFDRDSFHASVVARQGELNALSDVTPGARKRLVLGMLGVDALEEAIRRARQERKEAQAELENARKRVLDAQALSKRMAELGAEQSKAQAAVEEARRAQRTESKMLKALEAEAVQLDAARVKAAEAQERAEAARREMTAAETRRSTLRSELVALGKDAKRLEEVQAKVAMLRPKAARLEDLEVAREAFQRADEEARRLKALESEVKTLKEAADEAPRLRTRSQSLAEERRKAAQGMDSIRAELESNASRSGALTARLESLASPQDEHAVGVLGPEDPCPFCQRPLGGALEVIQRRHAHSAKERDKALDGTRRELSVVGQDRATLEAKRREAQAAMQDLEATWVSLSKQLARAEEAAKVWAHKRQQLEAARAQAAPPVSWDAKVYDEAKAAATALRALEPEESRLAERAARLAKVEAELEAASAQASEAARRLEEALKAKAKAGDDPPRRAALTAEVSALRDRQQAWARQEAGALARIQTLKEEIEASAPILEKAKGWVQEVKALETNVGLLEYLASAHGDKGLLQEFRTYLISRIRPALARSASDLVAAMTEGRYVAIELDEDYNVRVLDGATAHPLQRFSGGEVDIVNLALRLAINELVAQVRGKARLGFIALDEVFGSQDAQRRLHVLGALKGLARSFRQVLVITHHDEVQERLEHVVRVSADGASGSRLQPGWLDSL